jgi:hypothetical protein
MTTERPRCKCCGKPIPKDTDTVYAPREPNTAFPIADWQYRGNGIVTAKRYSKVNEERRLDYVTVWDGESYFPRFKYFCSIVCAARFGQQAASQL